jgi:hypothetical protein
MYIETATSWGPDWVFSASPSQGQHRRWSPGSYRPSLDEHSLASLPGEPATAEVIENEQARARLIGALNLFRSYGFTMHSEQNSIISEVSKDRSVALLKALPRQAQLPKVAPDGERGVVMVWDKGNTKFLLTVDEQGLHCIENAGTPDAVYHDDLYYDGAALPPQVALALGF